MPELELTQMASDGRALGRLGGKVVFLAYAVPGETVRVDIVRERPGWSEGRLLEILKPSGNRVDPPCPHFGPAGCGGCRWQHIRDAAQLRYKTRIVREQFRRVAKLPGVRVEAARPVGPAYGYRNHVQLRRSADGWGYVRADRRAILAIRTCPLMHKRLARMFEYLRALKPGPDVERILLRAGINTGDGRIVFEDKGGDRSTPLGPAHIHEEVAGVRYRISNGSFFQVNTAGAGALVEAVIEALNPAPEDSVLDLYSGVGLFSLPLAKRVRRVVAVESDPGSVEDAKAGAELAGAGNCEFLRENVESALQTMGSEFSAVLVDPPRRGCGKRVIDRLVGLRPPRLVYVSCDPATLARDARLLFEKGYRTVTVRPFDLFPQTPHIECVALFVPA
jgi:23S rRNA (uracil1939-C5)-methyltransferase